MVGCFSVGYFQRRGNLLTTPSAMVQVCELVLADILPERLMRLLTSPNNRQRLRITTPRALKVHRLLHQRFSLLASILLKRIFADTSSILLAITCNALAMIYAQHTSLMKLVKALAPKRLLPSWIAPTMSLQSAWQSRWVATATQSPV